MPKVRMKDFIQSTYKADYPIHRFTKKEDDSGVFVTGSIYTKEGFVTFYSWRPKDLKNNHSSLAFIYDGKIYQRSWHKSWSNRTLVRLANRFTKEIVETHTPRS